MAKAEIFTAEWFPYYFDRFEGSDRVAVMSLAEEGAYHRAIRLAWRFGSVPSDPALLAAKIQKRCTVKVAERVLSCFVPSDADPRKMVHPVLEEIRKEQEAKYLRYRKGGLATANLRWGYEEGGEKPPEKGGNDSPAIAQLLPSDSVAVADREKRDKIEIQTQIQNQISFKRLILRVREEKFPNEDPRIVEIGFLYTLLQRNGSTEPIRSVRYFDPQIKQALKDCKGLGEKGIESLLNVRRQQYWGEENERND